MTDKQCLPVLALAIFALVALPIGSGLAQTAGTESDVAAGPAADGAPADNGLRPPPIDKDSDIVVEVGSADSLVQVFDLLQYSYQTVRDENEPVPRVLVARLPEDIDGLDSVALRKSVFFNTLLPIVLRVNEEIMAERERLIWLAARVESGGTPTGDELDFLDGLAERYEVEDQDFDDLLVRVNIIPPSMALAQAAVESGWGRSRMALSSNALFGQITLNPTGTVGGDGQRYAAFDQLLDSVRSYARNLNTHPAYREFRRLRVAQLEGGSGLDGHALLAGLTAYSELGSQYVDYVRRVIRANDLHLIDAARLAGPFETAAAGVAAAADDPGTPDEAI